MTLGINLGYRKTFFEINFLRLIHPDVVLKEFNLTTCIETDTQSLKQGADTNEAVAAEASAPQDVGSLLTVDEQTVDIPSPRGVDEIGGRVGPAGQPRDQRLHTIAQTQQREGGQIRGGDLESSLEVTGVDQVVWVPTRFTTSAK